MDRRAPTTAHIPPIIGKYIGLEIPKKDPTSSERETPRQSPGNKVGSRTQSDIPTNEASIASTQRATIARSNPTGTKSGSKNTYVRKPDRTAESNPEKYLVLLLPHTERSAI